MLFDYRICLIFDTDMCVICTKPRPESPCKKKKSESKHAARTRHLLFKYHIAEASCVVKAERLTVKPAPREVVRRLRGVSTLVAVGKHFFAASFWTFYYISVRKSVIHDALA